MDYSSHQEFDCPYCGEPLSTEVDFTAGRKQTFTQDCEVCCKPITITVVLDEDGVADFSAETEA